MCLQSHYVGSRQNDNTNLVQSHYWVTFRHVMDNWEVDTYLKVVNGV